MWVVEGSLEVGCLEPGVPPLPPRSQSSLQMPHSKISASWSTRSAPAPGEDVEVVHEDVADVELGGKALRWPDRSDEGEHGALKWPDTSARNTFVCELEGGVARDVEDLEGAEGGVRGAEVLEDADVPLLPVFWDACVALVGPVGGLGLGDVEVEPSRAYSSSKKFFETREWSVAC